MRWRAGLRLPTLAAAIVVSACASEDEVLEEFQLSLWHKSVNLRAAVGYKDNVLLSKANQEGSAFWMSAADLALLRAGLDDGPEVIFFASAEDRRYFSGGEIDKEQLVLAQGTVVQQVPGDWFIGGLAQYLYADQVFDASATEQIFETLPVKSHNLQLAPILRRPLPWKGELELKLTGERQWFNEPLDDYWEFGPELTFTRNYGSGSTFELSYTYDHRRYDSRSALDLAFDPITGVPLRFDQHELELTLNHAWDRERRWRSRLRFLVEWNRDSGIGFYDYRRFRIMHRAGYWGEDWQATIEGKVLHYDYERQPVPGTGKVRQVWEYVVALHAEKMLGKALKLFADYEFETVHSNYGIEEYSVSTVVAGVDWEF